MHTNISASLVSIALAIVETVLPVEAFEDHSAQAAQLPIQQEASSEAWLKNVMKMAEKGDAQAQCKLAALYESGTGVPADPAEAEKWYEKASLNSSRSNRGAALAPSTGSGEDKRSLSEWQSNADKGDPEAQYQLGYRYAHGQGVKKDLGKARELLGKSADQGCAAAQSSLGYMYEHGTGVERDCTRAIELYKKAAEQHYAGALNNLGVMFANGVGLPKDYAEAVKCFEESATQGDAHAQCNLGWMYQTGRGVEQSFARAAQLYKRAAAHGMTAAKYNLGYLYQYGRGVEEDRAKSEKLYAMANTERFAAAKAKSASVNEEDVLGFMCRLGQLPTGSTID